MEADLLSKQALMEPEGRITSYQWVNGPCDISAFTSPYPSSVLFGYRVFHRQFTAHPVPSLYFEKSCLDPFGLLCYGSCYCIRETVFCLVSL
jgi:hypothetical protein